MRRTVICLIGSSSSVLLNSNSKGSVWDRVDRKLQVEEKQRRTTGSVPPDAALSGDATVEQLLSKQVGLEFDVLGSEAMGGGESLWDDEQPLGGAATTIVGALSGGGAGAKPTGITPSTGHSGIMRPFRGGNKHTATPTSPSGGPTSSSTATA